MARARSIWLAPFGMGSVLAWILSLGILVAWTVRLEAAGGGTLSEHFQVRVYDQADGLDYFAVSSIAATPDGRLWIATFRDLARFDGASFERVGEGDAPGFSQFQVRTLTTDSGGRLWFGGAGRVGVLEKGRWRFYVGEQGVPRFMIRTIVVTPGGEVWAAWDAGIIRLRKDVFESVNLPEGMGTDGYNLVLDEFGRVGCWTARGIAWWDAGGWKRQSMPTDVAGQAICGMIPARGGGLWVALGSEVRRLESEKWGAARMRPEGMQGEPVAMLEDRRGGLWLGGWTRGLVWYGPDGGMTVGTTGDGLASNSVSSLLEDDAGNVWVGSNGGYLARLRPLTLRVYGAEGGLGHVVNSVVEEEPGVLAVGTHGGGLMRWRDGMFQRHPKWTGPGVSDTAFVHAVLRDGTGDLWVGTQSPGLMHEHEGRWEVISPGLTGAQIIRALHEDRRGRLWVGTAAGVAVRENGVFRVLDDRSGLPHMVVHGLAEDREGRMWVCGMGYGLFREGDGRFERVPVAGLDERAAYAAMAGGRDGSMWVGVMGQGVVRVRDGRSRLYGGAEGVAVGFAVALKEDDDGQLWVWSHDRCVRVPVESFDAVEAGRATRLGLGSFDRRDGFPGAPRMGFCPVVSKGADGRLWWATVKGVAVVDVRRLIPQPSAPGIAWRWLHDGDSDGKAEPIWERDVDLGRPREFLDANFRADRFGSPEHVRYSARLLPHGAWHDVLRSLRVSMQDLRPGRYRLEVRASEREGEWGIPSSVQFEVPTPFWRQGWFMGVSVLGAAGLVLPTVRWLSQRRLRQRMLRLEQETLLERERTRIAQNLHDDLGASVTRVALMLERVVTTEPMSVSAMERVKDGLRVVRGTMGTLDAAVWAVNPANDTLGELVAYLGQMVVDYCQGVGLRAVLELPESPAERRLGAEWRHHVVLIVKEALNNAVKHSGGTEIRLRIVTASQGMNLRVADNGQGLAGIQRRREGRGMGNLRSRAEAMGGSLEIRSEPGTGVQVMAFIPWPKDRLP